MDSWLFLCFLPSPPWSSQSNFSKTRVRHVCVWLMILQCTSLLLIIKLFTLAYNVLHEIFSTASLPSSVSASFAYSAPTTQVSVLPEAHQDFMFNVLFPLPGMFLLPLSPLLPPSFIQVSAQMSPSPSTLNKIALTYHYFLTLLNFSSSHCYHLMFICVLTVFLSIGM